MKFSISMSLIFISSFLGCVQQNAQKLEERMSLATQQEKLAYQALIEVETSQGLEPAKRLKDWAKSLLDLDAVATEAYHAISNLKNLSTNEKAIFHEKFNRLDQEMLEIINRKHRFDLKIPEWLFAEAQNDSVTVRQTLNSIRGLPAKTIQTRIVLNLIEDKDVINTFKPCVDRFELLSLNLKNTDCSRVAYQKCGTQMDLECVDLQILAHKSEDCSWEEDVSSTDIDGVYMPATMRHTQNWLNEVFVKCVSTCAVLRK